VRLGPARTARALLSAPTVALALGCAFAWSAAAASGFALPHENAVPGGVKILRLEDHGAAVPRGKGEVTLYLDGAWYALDLSAAAPADGSRASALERLCGLADVTVNPDPLHIVTVKELATAVSEADILYWRSDLF